MSIESDLVDFRAGWAVAPAPLELLEVGGPDRERLLHGLVTGEIRRLASGSVAQGFFTTGQGRILADYRLLAHDEKVWLLVPAGAAAALLLHLEKYRLASRVELRAAAGLPIFSGGGSRPVAAGDELFTAADPVALTPRFLLLPRDPALAGDPARTMDGDALERLGLHRVGAEVLELARIEDGELRFGVDFGAENFPQETGRASAVSYNKGCFLGQEVVARIHYRGGVQKKPCGLRFEGGKLAPAGAELTLEGRAVGRATSVADSPELGAIGLGILHQRGAEPGTMLAFEGGEARVVALPFEKS